MASFALLGGCGHVCPSGAYAGPYVTLEIVPVPAGAVPAQTTDDFCRAACGGASRCQIADVASTGEVMVSCHVVHEGGCPDRWN